MILPEGIKSLINEFPQVGDELIPLHEKLGSSGEKCRYWGCLYDAEAPAEANIEDHVKICDLPALFGDNKPFWRNPSKEVEVGRSVTMNYQAIHTLIETKHENFEEEGAFGSCIHRILCAINEEMTDSEISSIVNRFFEDNGFSDALSLPHFISSARAFYNWLTQNFPGAVCHKEYPLMMEKDCQMVNGIADLVVETPDKVILIDYKTFSGNYDPDKNRSNCEWKAKTYGGQLALYQEILEKARPGKVVELWIWFVIAGVMVEVKTD